MEIDPEKLDQEAEKEGIKDEVEELFGDDEMIPEKKEKKKKKDKIEVTACRSPPRLQCKTC
jgi:hypothetical protein